MIANVTNVIEWLRLNKLTYWVVQLKDTDNTRVFESDDKLSFEDNIATFQRVMDVSSGSRFIIKASDGKDAKRGKFLEEFRNMSDGLPAVGSSPQSSGIYGTNEIDAIVAKRIKEYEQEQEFKRLKEERDEYKKEAERRLSISEEFMERSLPYIGTLGQFLLQKIIPAATSPATIAMAGFENQNQVKNQNTTEMEEIIFTEEQTDRIEAALQKLAKADKDCIAIIEKIAEMASTKDPMFAMAKSMLIK
jgi:hypothetical protein